MIPFLFNLIVTCLSDFLLFFKDRLIVLHSIRLKNNLLCIICKLCVKVCLQ